MMKSQLKNLDAIQIVGFVISAAVSIGLLVAGQDKVASVTLGFVLAILTQLFDIQKRLNDSEERLLQANALSKALYRDEWLLKHINQIVRDYQSVKGKWFELFKRRAEDTVIESRNVLHSMAEGYLIVDLRSSFRLGPESLAIAKKSLKAVAAAELDYWRSSHAQKYLQANAEAVRRGVKFTRVFVHTPDTLRGFVDILEQQQSLGIDVYVAFPDNVPVELCEDYLIVDDKIFAKLELTNDGRAREQRISIDTVEIERMTKRFDTLLRYSRKIDEMAESLKQ
jgi:hypothetical protein